jgi:hypothetical protein
MQNKIYKSAWELMSMGGDDRITIDEEIGYNMYGCKPYPAYSIPYSSCTGNNISLPAYAYIQSYLNKIRFDIENENLELKQVLKNEFGVIRNKMRNFYELEPSTDIIFGPSGTDMEYMAIVIAEKPSKEGVHNIVLGANEVGSGIKYAAKAQFFSAITPTKKEQKIGDYLEGFGHHSSAFIPIRSGLGKVYSDRQIIANFEKEIQFALSNNKKPLVHILHSTKTGLILPNWDSLLKLKNKYGESVEIIVDACQGRVSIYSINRYLSIGAMVLLTGSKFLSGPSFSGALLLPKFISERIKSIDELPKGLAKFFGQAGLPIEWTTSDNPLYKFENIGLLLRWQAAIYEMNKIFRIPDHRLKYVIDCFNQSVNDMVADADYITLFDHEPNQEVPDYVYSRSPFEIKTIRTILIKRKDDRHFSQEEAKIIHKALYTDISNIIDYGDLTKTPIQLGQPVKISDVKEEYNATLRIALSSNLISELALLDDDLIKMKFFSDMDMINKKLSIIIDHFSSFNVDYSAI